MQYSMGMIKAADVHTQPGSPMYLPQGPQHLAPTPEHNDDDDDVDDLNEDLDDNHDDDFICIYDHDHINILDSHFCF